MQYRYVPFLRPKRGERVGLEKLTPAGRQGVVPFFILEPTRYVGKKETKTRPAVSPPTLFVQELSTAWGAGRFYLDASILTHAGTAAQQPIALIAARARAKGLKLIPATWLGAPSAYQQAVATVMSADNRGVGLRVGLEGMTSAPSWIAKWPHLLNETDLLVDLGPNVATVADLGGSVNHAFANLRQAKSWRTVTVIGTSMPDNFQGYLAGLHQIKRVEWALWQRLISLNLPYRLDYGDYSTVPVNPPPSGIKWGYPITVRYTLDTEFLISRGVNTTGLGAVDMDVQLIGHADSIANFNRRHPLPQCWADQRIDNIAARTKGPGGLETWVQIGVNRHIELVRTCLP